MKLRKLIALLSALLMLCSVLPLGALPATAESVDVMTNGNLETGDTTGFATVNGTSVTNAKSHGGSYAFKATNTSATYSTLVKSAPIKVQSNTDYTASFWYYYEGSNAAPSFYLYLKDESNSKNISSVTINPAAKGTWTQVTHTFNTGNNETILFLLQNKTASDGGAYYFDDLSLTCDSAVIVDPDERFSNGNLEKGNTSGYATVNGTSLTTEKAHGGKYALKATNTVSLWSTMVKTEPISVKPNTEYTTSFWYYCDSSHAAPSFYLFMKDGSNSNDLTSWESGKAVVGEWTYVSKTFNTGEYDSVRILLQNKTAAAGGSAVYYFDDLSIKGPDPNYVDPNTSPDVPGNKVKNGTFDIGAATDWNVFNGSAASADAKYRGGYGLTLSGNGGWGSMANQDVSVTAGKTYVVSARMKTVAVGANVQIKDGSSSGTLLGSGWFDAADWTRVAYTITPTTNTIHLNFCGGGNGNAETVYVDDVAVVEPAYDGYLYNGNFEVGEADPWVTTAASAVTIEAANEGLYGLHLVGEGTKTPIAYQDIPTEAGKTYAFSASFRSLGGGCNIYIRDEETNRNLASEWYNTNSWNKRTIEFTAVDSTTRIAIYGSGKGSPESIYMDSASVYEIQQASYDGYLYNGTFETGSLDYWVTYQSTQISTAAAYNGRFGCKASGVGNWGATLYQNIKVDPGKTYKISFYYRVESTGMNFGVCTTDDKTNLISQYLDNKSGWLFYEGEFKSGYLDTVRVKFHCTGKGGKDEILVDDIKVECLSGDEMDRRDNLHYLGASIRDTAENKKGLAFGFRLDAAKAQVRNNYELVDGSATIYPYEYGTVSGKLIEAGALVSNLDKPEPLTLDDPDGVNTIRIPAKYVSNVTADSFDFAVRIINIPDHCAQWEIYARPYYIFSIDGQETIIYGEMIHQNYTAIDAERTRMRVLTIGGNDAYDETQTYLRNVLLSAGYDQVILGNLCLEGDRLAAMKNASPVFTYHSIGDHGQWITTDNVSAISALRQVAWDVIVVDLPEADATELAAAVSWARTNQPDSSTRIVVRNNQKVSSADAIIAPTAAIKNLATVMPGDSLTDSHRRFTYALAWYLGVTGETLDLITYIPSEVRDQYFNMGRAAAHATAAPNKVTDLTETLLLAGSDYQPGNWKDGPPIVEGLISSTMSDGTTLFDGFFAGGDYAAMAGYDVSMIGIHALDDIISKVAYGNKIYVEGNHDDPAVDLIDPYGPNDPVGGTYGVFVMNEENYVAYGGNGQAVAADLTNYLNEKIGNKSWGNKPIFILSHVPLHYSRRTEEQGCATGGPAIVDALNKGGAAGLNIIFLFAHNHGSAHDDHIGGGSVYLKKGDTLWVCGSGGMTAAPTTKTLKFTYMNYGYINNYADHGSGVDKALTMTTFRIRQDGAVIITRYDKDGVHNLKSEGKLSSNDGEYVKVYPTVYESSRIVTATDDQPYKE